MERGNFRGEEESTCYSGLAPLQEQTPVQQADEDMIELMLMLNILMKIKMILIAFD